MATPTNEDRAIRQTLSNVFSDISTAIADLDNAEREIRRSGSGNRGAAIDLIASLKTKLNACERDIVSFKNKYYR